MIRRLSRFESDDSNNIPGVIALRCLLFYFFFPATTNMTQIINVCIFFIEFWKESNLTFSWSFVSFEDEFGEEEWGLDDGLPEVDGVGDKTPLGVSLDDDALLLGRDDTFEPKINVLHDFKDV